MIYMITIYWGHSHFIESLDIKSQGIGHLADNATKKFEILNDQKSFMSKLCESGGCSKILLISLNVGVVAISEL